MRVVDNLSGSQRIATGPGGVFLGPHEQTPGSVETSKLISQIEYVRVTNRLTGAISHFSGPALFTPEVTEDASDPRHKTRLSSQQYVRVTSSQTGVVRIEQGPQLLMPGVYDSLESVQSATTLSESQYLRVTHQLTGVVRHVDGPTQYLLQE